MDRWMSSDIIRLGFPKRGEKEPPDRNTNLSQLPMDATELKPYIWHG